MFLVFWSPISFTRLAGSAPSPGSYMCTYRQNVIFGHPSGPRWCSCRLTPFAYCARSPGPGPVTVSAAATVSRAISSASRLVIVSSHVNCKLRAIFRQHCMCS